MIEKTYDAHSFIVQMGVLLNQLEVHGTKNMEIILELSHMLTALDKGLQGGVKNDDRDHK